MSDENELVKRIEKVERQNRRMAWFGGSLFLIVLFTSLFFARAATRKDVLQAKEFILRDDSGRVLARLSNDGWGTCLELRGKERVSEAYLCVGDHYGSSLTLLNEHGSTRAFLSAGFEMHEGGRSLVPGLVIAEADGRNLISANLGPDVKLVVGHGTEENSIVMSTPEGKPAIKVVGNAGKALWTAP
jgi:hypothetical protein